MQILCRHVILCDVHTSATICGLHNEKARVLNESILAANCSQCFA